MYLLYILVLLSIAARALMAPLSEATASILPASTTTPRTISPLIETVILLTSTRTTTPKTVSPTAKTEIPHINTTIPAIASAMTETGVLSNEETGVEKENLTELNSLEDSYDKTEYERVVDHKVFWAGWTVICDDVETMLSKTTDPLSYPMINNRRRPIITPLNYANPTYTARRYIKKCENCVCDEDGNVIAHEVGLIAVHTAKCDNQDDVDKCKYWFGCYCRTNMVQPDIVPGNSISDYQDALNNVPFGVKQQYPAFEWKPTDRFSMSWQGLAKKVPNNAEAGPADQWLVPGTMEPYYLEGPSKEPTREWMNPHLGFRGGTLGSSFVKRGAVLSLDEPEVSNKNEHFEQPKDDKLERKDS
ncbi:hypothetical protein TWF281_001690 [Arthrobotrys megalospora]